MSAAVVSDRAHMKKRGAMLAWIFSNQGWGNLAAGVLGVIVIAGYRDHVEAGDVHKLSGAWRILQGLSLIPAFIALYFRLTMVESTRFTQARAIQDDPELLNKASSKGVVVGRIDSEEELALEKAGGDVQPMTANTGSVAIGFGTVGQKPHNEFISYFSEWRHFKVLLGCSLSWFLVDIAFYGINLNQSAILTAINFTTGNTWSKLMKTATGNLIITVAGFFPGYFFTVALIEPLGRKPIQILGFAMNMLFLGILGGLFNEIKTSEYRASAMWSVSRVRRVHVPRETPSDRLLTRYFAFTAAAHFTNLQRLDHSSSPLFSSSSSLTSERMPRHSLSQEKYFPPVYVLQHMVFALLRARSEPSSLLWVSPPSLPLRARSSCSGSSSPSLVLV